MSRGCSRRSRATEKPSLAAAPGFEILHEHVGPRDHCGKERLVIRLGEIEHNGFLAAVEPDEITALAVYEVVVAAREVALRALDLDHAGARVRKATGAHRRGDGLLERNDQEAG